MNRDEYSEQIAQMSKSMFRYCLSRTNSYHDAEDLAQEILLISCKGENSFPNEKAFYAFVWRTAENILRGWYRDKNRHDISELDETLSDGSWESLEEQAAENEQLRLLTRELSHLNSNYRHVMVAHYVDGLSVKDISERFLLSQSMVKYLLFQSRKRIREGVNMERNYGKLSYQPINLNLFFWGGKNNYYDKFDSRLAQNIMMACYYDRQNEEQISLQLGVPTAYLEDDIRKLVKYELLTEKNGFYQTNVPIITKETLDEITRANKQAVGEITKYLSGVIDKMLIDVKELGFYGSDMSNNSLKWMLLSLILRLAYVDMAQSDHEPDYPTDIFGEKCFRLFVENDPGESSSGFLTGISASYCKNGLIAFCDVAINGAMRHPKVTAARGDMLCRLMNEQPQTDNEKLVCSELIELGLAVKTEDGIRPNFPCLTKEQGDVLNNAIRGIGREICQDALSRLDMIKEILTDHAPAHLVDYVGKLPVLLIFNETEQIMRELCESGWLIPMKSGMSGTTVMYMYE
ncbi:RNA polymerase sigma factor [Ruminococcus albus]|uniref:RNA polymerase sigma factor, sigma-70 family n=1 Tax=Ruminococcus albus TaxID=1264 RepID=A0A1H7LJI7_RUMAL|nr:sigma-70 family RNA polymerase sigma factor [Ruminococcus albus]SEK99133.1 RNA polymerase sigma factor, sigma-70 family [Ruminococcus albus]